MGKDQLKAGVASVNITAPLGLDIAGYGFGRGLGILDDLYPLGLVSRIRATSSMRNYGLDFDDATVVQALEELSSDTIVSYDDDFDSLEWIKRRISEELF